MHIPHIYLNQELATHSTVMLTEKNYHHLVNVMRCAVGEKIIIFNGKGGFYHARIASIKKKQIHLEIFEYSFIDNESTLFLHFSPAISRNDKMDFIIQKAVELGVTTITPVITQRCKLKLDAVTLQKKMARWEEIIINACEQCERYIIPTIHPPCNFNSWISQTHQGIKLFCDPTAAQNIKNMSPPSSATLLIGPESGFSEDEKKIALEKEFIGVSLGPRILRTETAAVAAITVLQYQWGDLK